MDAQNPERHFPTRATALVLNSQGHVLVVRHRGQAEWALPGGQVHAGEDPVRRVVVEVAQETGLGITTPTYMGEYEGTRVAHQIFLAEAEGELHPDLREVEEAAWWNPDTPLGVQPHVDGILEIVLDSLEQGRGRGRRSCGGDVRAGPGGCAGCGSGSLRRSNLVWPCAILRQSCRTGIGAARQSHP